MVPNQDQIYYYRFFSLPLVSTPSVLEEACLTIAERPSPALSALSSADSEDLTLSPRRITVVSSQLSPGRYAYFSSLQFFACSWKLSVCLYASLLYLHLLSSLRIGYSRNSLLCSLPNRTFGRTPFLWHLWRLLRSGVLSISSLLSVLFSPNPERESPQTVLSLLSSSVKTMPIVISRHRL